MQRWSIGQSRNIQGAQSGGTLIICPLSEYGLVVSGLVGPKITSVGRPSADAMCAGPVSFVTNRSTTLNTPTSCVRLVSPVRTIGLRRILALTCDDTSNSASEPIKTTSACKSAINRSPNAAKRSAGQRFALLLIDPGQSAITLRSPETPWLRNNARAST